MYIPPLAKMFRRGLTSTKILFGRRSSSNLEIRIAPTSVTSDRSRAMHGIVQIDEGLVLPGDRG